MTKTRIKFLLAMVLIALPFLGFPTSVDMVIVPITGFLIASITFIQARQNRFGKKLNMSVDPVKKSMRAKMKRATVQAKSEKVSLEEAEVTESSIVEDTQPKRGRVASPILTGTHTGIQS